MVPEQTDLRDIKSLVFDCNVHGDDTPDSGDDNWAVRVSFSPG